MSRRRPREEEDDDEGTFVSRMRSAIQPRPRPPPSLFSLELEKSAGALHKFYNTVLKNKVARTNLDELPQSLTDGMPAYQFWNAVAEYRRGQREVELRFGGVAGEVYCFGSNEMFQQGLPDLTDLEEQEVDNMTPHKLGINLPDIRQVQAGGTSLAALDIHGQVFTWGSSDDGVLGRIIEPHMDSDKAQATPTPVKGFITADGMVEDGRITQMAVGAAHMIYLSASGNVYFNGVFKDNDSGLFSPPDPKFVVKGVPPDEPAWFELSKGVDAPDYTRQPDTYGIVGHKKTPIQISSLKRIVSVYSGADFCAVITEDRQVKTFGTLISPALS